MTRWTGALGTVGALGGVLLMTACGGGARTAAPVPIASGASGVSGAPAAAAAASSAASVARIAIEPKDGSRDVAPGALRVSVASGKLTQVAVVDAKGAPVAGALAADGLSWAPAAGLAVGASYRVTAQAVDAGGAVADASSGFSTLSPKQTVTASDNVVSGKEFGVGMIIRVDFQGTVKNREAAARAITVQASDNTQVRGHWFDGSRLDLRPEGFWKPGTTVKVHFGTSNVELAPGVYGGPDRDESFTIGRSKISDVDTTTHRMLVKEDGKPDTGIPVTAGSDDNPSWNGTMVVSAMSLREEMDSATVPDIKGVGYKVFEPHALRLTDTGTYVHGNPAATVQGALGSSNISHGCIGLSDVEGGGADTTAGRYYADSLIGDVVRVQHSVKTQALAPDNGLSGWNTAWANW